MKSEIMSLILFTCYKQKLKIACPACLLKEMNTQLWSHQFYAVGVFSGVLLELLEQLGKISSSKPPVYVANFCSSNKGFAITPIDSQWTFLYWIF